MSAKARLEYHSLDRDELAEHLGRHEILCAEVCAGLTVYRCTADTDGETLAIALPDGGALIVSPPPSANRMLDRRRKPG